MPAIPGIETAVHALPQQCGGNPDVVILDNVMRNPVCDLTAAQAEANRAAMNANQREVTDRMARARLEQVPFKGRAPGDMCLPQGEVPAGAWTPAPWSQPS